MGKRLKGSTEQYEVPHPMIDLAQRRTEFLHRLMLYQDVPMRRILASAYMQGIHDAVQAFGSKDGV